jgi:hypothetical protein
MLVIYYWLREIFHNCVVHFLLPFLPIKLGDYIHEIDSRYQEKAKQYYNSEKHKEFITFFKSGEWLPAMFVLLCFCGILYCFISIGLDNDRCNVDPICLQQKQAEQKERQAKEHINKTTGGPGVPSQNYSKPGSVSNFTGTGSGMGF